MAKVAGESKSAQILAYIKANPDVGNTEVAKALSKLGVNAAYVATIRSNAKRAKSKGKTAPKAKASKPGRKAGKAKSVGVSFEQVIAAKALVTELGGVDKVRATLDAAQKVILALGEDAEASLQALVDFESAGQPQAEAPAAEAPKGAGIKKKDTKTAQAAAEDDAVKVVA